MPLKWSGTIHVLASSPAYDYATASRLSRNGSSTCLSDRLPQSRHTPTGSGSIRAAFLNALGPRSCEMEPLDRVRYGSIEGKLHSLQQERRMRLNAAIRILTLGLVRNLTGMRASGTFEG
jgi:hypothetical protein